MLAKACGDVADACPTEETDGGIPEEGHHRGALPGMQGALVLPERDILDAMQAGLDSLIANGKTADAGHEGRWGSRSGSRPRAR